MILNLNYFFLSFLLYSLLVPVIKSADLNCKEIEKREVKEILIFQQFLKECVCLQHVLLLLL